MEVHDTGVSERAVVRRLAEAARVRNTAGMARAEALQDEDDNVITVDVSRGLDGVTFALYPLSQDYLRSLGQSGHLWPRVFIGRETPADFEQLELPLQRHVIQLLTGLSLERLRELGLQVDFFDVRSCDFLVTYDPAADPATPSASDSDRR